MSIPTTTLNSGCAIPVFGFGTYKVAPTDAQHTIETVLELGIRHIDTAQMYGNEREIGFALAATGLPREELFITTKLNNCNHKADDAVRTFEQSLRDLRVDYVDLFLMHWPVPMHYGGDFTSTWKTMMTFADDKRAHSIGVSNFQTYHLEKIINETGFVPAVNQIEAHPRFANNTVRAFNAAHGIITEAWSPLGRGEYFDDPTLQDICRQTGKTPAQVVLRWAVQRGDVVFPKASTVARIKENMGIFDWQLDAQQVAALDGMDAGEAGRMGPHPDTFDMI